MAPVHADIRAIAPRCAGIVLVCRKCQMKLDGGFGAAGDQRLGKALRRVFRQSESHATLSKKQARRSRPAVIEVGCLDLCPKGGVMALRADRPDDWLIIRAGTPIADVVDRLGFGAPSSSRGA